MSNDADEGVDEDDVPVCETCGGTPCEWEEFGVRLMEYMKMMYYHNDDENMMTDQKGNIVPNSTVRKGAYKLFTYMKFGNLGKGTRIPVPDCVTHVRKNHLHSMSCE